MVGQEQIYHIRPFGQLLSHYNKTIKNSFIFCSNALKLGKLMIDNNNFHYDVKQEYLGNYTYQY